MASCDADLSLVVLMWDRDYRTQEMEGRGRLWHIQSPLGDEGSELEMGLFEAFGFVFKTRSLVLLRLASG